MNRLKGKQKQTGILYIVSTPIGNFRDITFRAVEVLKQVDFVICEEYRRGSTLLKKLEVLDVDCLELNEHNEESRTPQIVDQLVMGRTAALISDCGTPGFADPGTLLIKYCIETDIKVVPVPGPSSLMAAISLSPLPLEEFLFAGFLPRRAAEREKRISGLRKYPIPIILMDTPYRLNKLLQEVCQHWGNKKVVTLALDLTKPTEHLYHGGIEKVIQQVEGRKAEFILIIH